MMDSLSFQPARIETVLSAYEQAFDTLRQSVDRSPHNQRVVRAIGNLLEAATQPFTPEEVETILTHSAIRSRQFRMWEFLAQAESAMERYQSARLDGSNLHSFRYFGKNYDRLVSDELAQLGYPATQVMLKPTQSIVFVEAGPLPLSAVLVHRKTKMAVTCIDADRANAELGRKFLTKCGMASHITYRFADGDDYDYSPHPIVFMSSFVRNKASIMENICEGGYGVETLAVRSAQGIYTLLYEPITAKLATALRVSFNRQTTATPETINTTLFADLLKLPEARVAPPKVEKKGIFNEKGKLVREVAPDNLEKLKLNVRRRPKGRLEPD